ncbi:MAG TPA: hypothetical protein VK760_04935 [Candidatus Acidoferrales bacterium]|nr:hypothetical protein [Candidatus Acidoferrales bacterium]
MPARADRPWTASIVVITGLAFAAFLAAKGVPALRHDWVWVTGGGFLSNTWSSLSGWTAIGIGSPRPYPADYLLAVTNVVLVAVLGTYGGFIADAFAVGAVCAGGAIAITRRFTDARAAWIAAAAFAAFNPWVYNKVVAGHLGMVLAYGATMLLLAQLSRERPSPFLTGLYLLLTMQQLQFFFPLLAVVAIWTLVRRESVYPLGAALLASMPIWIGLLCDRAYLLSIPYTQSWQADASLDPIRALELSGYFVKYADALPPPAGVAIWAIAALAAIGAIVECIRRPLRAAWLVALAVALWLFVSGTKGALGGAYLWIVAHVPESGLYRELYDLVAFLAIGYLAATAASVRRVAALQWVWLPCAAALVVSWAFAPPARFWVAARDLPPISVDAPANTRYALMPPMQPLRLGESGDGLDPNAVVLPDNVVPLNTVQFSFPESPALAHYAFTGDDGWLRALSVSAVIERPELHTNLESLHMQFALPPKAFAPPAASRRIGPAPELELTGVPPLGVLPSMPWENAVFFGDAHGVRGPGVPDGWSDAAAVTPMRPSFDGVFAADGWVDVRTAFAVMPQLAQGIGGAITTNPNALLPLDPALQTLAYVDGTLDDANGATLSRSTRGYAWLAPLGVAAVRCTGTCVVAAQSTGPPRDRTRERRCTGAPAFWAPAAWLAIADVPPAGTCLLRYNVRFDEHWLAFTGTTRLAHVAIDSIVNGWLLPDHAATQRVVIIEGVAFVQFAFMALSILVLVACAAARAYALVRR